MQFRDLRVGQTFDFVGPDRIMNSFYDRCMKLSERKYSPMEGAARNKTMRVGSITCEVYNVK